MNNLDLNMVRRVKRLAVLAMISEDDLMELLIFKGGSAIDMIYHVTGRSSLDLDFSMESSLTEDEEMEIGEKIKSSLKATFLEDGLVAFDVVFGRRPFNMSDDVRDFWGGYQVSFKVIPEQKAEAHNYDIGEMQRRALPLGDRGKASFKIDISSYEFCGAKRMEDFEDFTIYVYSPEMIVFEKLRAICQQIPDYEQIVKTNRRARGRDFYDIFLLMEQFGITPETEENKDLVRNIFAAKKVPLAWIKRIRDYREYHRENFESSLRDTVSEGTESFDHYFDFVLDKFESLEFTCP